MKEDHVFVPILQVNFFHINHLTSNIEMVRLSSEKPANLGIATLTWRLNPDKLLDVDVRQQDS